MNNSQVILKIDHTVTYVEGQIERSVYDQLRKALGYKPENLAWMVLNSSRNKYLDKWDGIVSTLKNPYSKKHGYKKYRGTYFPSGLIYRAKKVLEENKVNLKIEDIRDLNAAQINKLDLITSNYFELRDYQLDAVDRSFNKQRGIIQICTGGGKTGVAAKLISEIKEYPFIFYVTSIELLEQAASELERFLRYSNGNEIKVGRVGGGHKDIKDITVMTVQTAVRSLGCKYVKFDDEDSSSDDTEIDDIKETIKELIFSARGMICDEVHHWASETCQLISDASASARWRYGMSATPFRDMNDDILIESCFGRAIVNISASFLIQNGYLVKPEIFFIPIKNMKNTQKSSFPNVYKHAIVENFDRNIIIANIAKKLLETGKQPLILCKHINHGNILQKLIPDSTFLHGSSGKKNRLKHLDKMRAGQAGITISSVIFDEGIDCRPLNSLILAGSGKSGTRALQRIGRTLRPYTYENGQKKESALIIDFEDHCKYMLKHSRRRKAIYQKEPEFEIKYLNP